MAHFRTRFSPILLSLGAIAAAGCGGGGSESARTGKTSDVITIDGSSTVMPITEAIAEDFMKANPGTRVTVGESGTSGGFGKFCRNESDINDASRPIKESEVAECAKLQISTIELPVAYDGLTVVVNPKNTWAASMTLAELKKLWSPEAQNKITRWSQVRAGWPDREIHLFGPGTASGTFEYFNEAVNGNAKASRGDYTASEDDNALVQGVAGDELALGYFGLAYYEVNKARLKAVALDDEKPENGAGPIVPGFDTVRNGSYPLSRPLFIYANSARLSSRPELQQFVDFYLKAPVDTVRRVGYVPLTDAERQLVQQRFAAKKTGSMYGSGAPAGTLEERLKGGR